VRWQSKTQIESARMACHSLCRVVLFDINTIAKELNRGIVDPGLTLRSFLPDPAF